MSDEFDLIQRYFHRQYDRSDIEIGNGDDCAVVSVPVDHQLAITTDTLIEGVHFPVGTLPERIGHKALAVSLSDLAAMGSVPKWFTLSISLPQHDEAWLSGFSKGLFALADQFNVALIGGDTTRGPLSITIQAMGSVADGRAVRRSTAQVGDDIYVTGTIGDAALGLKALTTDLELPGHHLYHCQQRLDKPSPRISSGIAASPFVTAMIDCSDGLVADLGHLLVDSGLGGVIKTSRVPLSESVKDYAEETKDWELPLAGGDDYELIFTASPDNRSIIAALPEAVNCPITWLGTVTTHDGLVVLGEDDVALDFSAQGYKHF